MLEKRITVLLDLLAAESAALRNGDLQDLPAIADRKSALAQDIASSAVPRAELARIRQALDRNARLLLAARDGVKAAQTRLSALRSVRDGLSLYTAGGDRTTVARRSTGLEHKA